jgi:hypothetical protein
MFCNFDYLPIYVCYEIDEFFRFVLTNEFMENKLKYQQKIHGYDADWNTSCVSKLPFPYDEYKATFSMDWDFTFHKNLNDWDVSNVKYLEVFKVGVNGRVVYKQPMTDWDVLLVKSMGGAFCFGW